MPRVGAAWLIPADRRRLRRAGTDEETARVRQRLARFRQPAQEVSGSAGRFAPRSRAGTCQGQPMRWIDRLNMAQRVVVVTTLGLPLGSWPVSHRPGNEDRLVWLCAVVRAAPGSGYRRVRMASPYHLAGRDQPLGTHLAQSAKPIPWSGRLQVTDRPSRDRRPCWLWHRT
jgi:hypothetical protein